MVTLLYIHILHLLFVALFFGQIRVVTESALLLIHFCLFVTIFNITCIHITVCYKFANSIV